MKKALIFLFVTLFLIILYRLTFSSVMFSVKMNWKLKLPLEDRILYEISTPSNFFGDGDRYYIIQYKSKAKIKTLLGFSWSTEKNTEIEEQALYIANRLNVKEQYLIDFNNDYQYYYASKSKNTEKLFIFYFEGNNVLFIIEQFS